MTNETLRLENLTASDIKPLLGLSESVGWDFNGDEWWTALTAGRIIGHRQPDDTPISCLGMFPFGPTLAVIGGVIVTPDMQYQGLGSALVERALRMLHAPDVNLSLVSTTEGETLYSNHGFNRETNIWKAESQVTPEGTDCPAGYRLETTLPVRDLAALLRLDAGAFGFSRGHFMKRRFAQAEYRAFVYDDSNTLVGSALGVMRGPSMLIGPVVAPSTELAVTLVQALASRHRGPKRIDVPVEHRIFREAVSSLGFEQVDLSPLMTRGDARPSQGWDRYFAISAQAFL